MVARGVGRVLDGEWIATDLGDRCKPVDVFPIVECTRSVDGQPLRFNSLAERVMNEMALLKPFAADIQKRRSPCRSQAKRLKLAVIQNRKT